MRRTLSRTSRASKCRIVTLGLALMGLALFAPSRGTGRLFLPVASAATSVHGPYTTNFTATENPISEGGKWLNGGVGAGASLWGDVRTNGTMAFGVNEPTTYGDPTAILTGTWGPSQTVTGVIKVNSTPGTCCHEVEVRLRTSIAANSITGYEILCPVWSSPNYGIQVVRWNGPNADYTYITAGDPHQCVNGDVLKATATGTNPTTIQVYLNGNLTLTGVDHGTETGPGKAAGPWTGGTPGVGFYDSADNNWSVFGFSSFTATDVSSSQPPAPPTNLMVTVQ